MIRSIWVWFVSFVLILAWLPMLMVVRGFDSTRNRIHTGLWFRRLGSALTRANPFWKLQILGSDLLPEERAFVVVCNHQSMADIPLISNVKWEMKWVAKEELFRTPVIGWMMKLAGDIPVDRRNARSGARMLLKSREYLDRGCPVMFFPEGTRSRDGRVGAFSDGAFHLARKSGVPVLPLAINGSAECLPKNSWIFGEPATITLKVFPPVESGGFGSVEELRERVRGMVTGQVEEWRKEMGDGDEGFKTSHPPSEISF